MTSEIEFMLISVAVGIVIVGVPLAVYMCNGFSSAGDPIASIIDETTPLRGKDGRPMEDDDDDLNGSYDSNIVINRILSNGVIMHTTKGPKKVCTYFVNL